MEDTLNRQALVDLTVQTFNRFTFGHWNKTQLIVAGEQNSGLFSCVLLLRLRSAVVQRGNARCVARVPLETQLTVLLYIYMLTPEQ